MIRRFLQFALGALALTSLSSCFVHSSLAYFDKDAEGKPNLLSNPGFSAYSADPAAEPLGWTIEAGESARETPLFAIDGQEAAEGNSSLRVDASDQSVVIISDAFRVRRYGGYYTRVRALADSEPGPQLLIQLLTYDDDGELFSRHKASLKTGSEWKKAAISSGFNQPGVSFARLRIEIPAFRDGSVWVDDAGCWEVHRFRID